MRPLQYFFRFYALHIYKRVQRWQDRAATLIFAQGLEYIGSGSTILHPSYVKNPQYITIGDNFVAGPGLRIEAWDQYAGHSHHPRIIIGDGVVANFNVHIGAIRRIEIGDNVLIGSNVLITDHSHGTTSEADLRLPPLLRPLADRGPVVIESNVWIGEGVCILPGVRVGTNAIIGANAVVTRDVPPGDVVGGIPARTIKSP